MQCLRDVGKKNVISSSPESNSHEELTNTYVVILKKVMMRDDELLCQRMSQTRLELTRVLRSGNVDYYYYYHIIIVPFLNKEFEF